MIPHPAFAVDSWSVRETYLDLDMLAQSESILALSNGHIGLRANLDEGEPWGILGTYLNGIFPASAFPAPTLGADGTLGRNTFRGPGFAQVDVSVSKRFAITEAVGLQLRLNAYNALNRVNLDNPVTDLNNNNFGRSTSQQTPRAFEAVLRLNF